MGVDPRFEEFPGLNSHIKKQKYIKMYMDIADVISKMSYAERKQVGAVIVKDDRIISMGWNGTPAGFDNKCEVDNQTIPEVLHAESNSIAKLAKSTESGHGATLYCTCQPCMECAKLIHQSGIIKVIYRDEYRDNTGVNFLKKANVEVLRWRLQS